MKRNILAASIALCMPFAAGLAISGAALAQQQPIEATVNFKTDLAGIEGKDALVLTVHAAPGAGAPRHFHPGHELAYVLEGSILVEIDGKPAITYKAAESFHIPPNVVHSARNASATAPLKVLVFGLFDKDRPNTIAAQ